MVPCREVIGMSRLGKKPIHIPQGVEVKYENGVIRVKGPKGQLEFRPHRDMLIEIQDGVIRVKRPSDKKFHRALHGTTRQLIANMIKGVTEGFTKVLELYGMGYRASIEGKNLVMKLGFSHDVVYPIPPDVKVEVRQVPRGQRGARDEEKQAEIVVSGIDKQRVGQVAAEIRQFKPVEPYKGKGIRYAGERVRYKTIKAGVKAG